jgi:hypothetical protein
MSKLNELVKIARYAVQKQAFVDAATAGSAGMPPGGDPAAMGMDPAAMGMDPAAMGGAAPPAPTGGDPALSAKLDQMMQMMQAGGGGGAAGGAGGMLKPKIDVNVEIMQIKNILAKIADALGVQIPAQDMVATPEKLTAMAQGQSTATPAGAMGGGGGGSSIPSIDPMQGASPMMAQGGGGGGGASKQSSFVDGEPAYDFTNLTAVGNRAAALAAVLEQRRA